VRPTVALALCTRNRPELAAGCAARLLESDPAPLEIIVIDQSETGETRRLLAALHDPASLLRVVATTTVGLSRARNLAFFHCRADVIAFTDDDCLPRRDWAGAIAEELERHPEADALTGPAVPEDSGLDERVRAATTWLPPGPVLHRGAVDPCDVGSGFNLVLRREALARLGGFDERLGPGVPLAAADDTDILHRILRSGGAVLYTPRAVVCHLPWRDAPEQRRVDQSYALSRGGWAALALRQGDAGAAAILARWAAGCAGRGAAKLFRGQAGAAAFQASLLLAALRGGLRGAASPAGRAPFLESLLASAGRDTRATRSVETPSSVAPSGASQGSRASGPR
jgi:GT2 family glycosyltransferase